MSGSTASPPGLAARPRSSSACTSGSPDQQHDGIDARAPIQPSTVTSGPSGVCARADGGGQPVDAVGVIASRAR